MVNILEEGIVEYPDLGYDKPVKYTKESLNKLLKSVEGRSIPLTLEHSNEILCHLNNFHVTDDGVFDVEIPSEINYKDKGFSPIYEMYLSENGDYLEPTSLHLINVGLTSKPRNTIIYNKAVDSTANKDDGVSVMDNKELEIALKRQRELENERASLQHQLKSQKDKLKELEKKAKITDELQENYAKLESKLKENEPKIAKYDDYVSKTKSDIIRDIVGESKELQEKYESFSLEQLQLIKDNQIVNTPVKGVSLNQAEGFNEGDSSKKDEDTFTNDDWVESYMKATGEKPNLVI